MQIFKLLHRKPAFSSTPAAPTSNHLRPRQLLAPTSDPAGEPITSVMQSQREQARYPDGLLDRISIFPPEQTNATSLPDTLKAGIETLSGLSMDDVRVHHNSFKPAVIRALAYTKGTDIHIGPGQERHLAHEAWHVVQQKLGLVKPTKQVRRVAINDQPYLEREADQMGTKARARQQDLSGRASNETHQRREKLSEQRGDLPLARKPMATAPFESGRQVVQRYLWDYANAAPYDDSQALRTQNPGWYQRLTSQQRTAVDQYADNPDFEHIYRVKEVLRKIGVPNLSTILGVDPANFEERETVLGGGLPRDKVSLAHVMNAYTKGNNLTVYDADPGPVYSQYQQQLNASQMQDINFQLGRPLSQRGLVQNHDFIIPHPGPNWILGAKGESLAQSLAAVLGHGSIAYILTDTTEDQKDELLARLQQFHTLHADVEKAVVENAGKPDRYILLGEVRIPIAFDPEKDNPLSNHQQPPYFIVTVKNVAKS